MNNYPNITEIENASPYQIQKWMRFLPSPENEIEVEIMNLIYEKYVYMKKSNEINSSISKQVGF